jgi:hypothetical protein
LIVIGTSLETSYQWVRGHGGRYLEVGIESTFCQGPLSCFSDSLLLHTIHSCTRPTDICIAQEVLSDESLGTSQAFSFPRGVQPRSPASFWGWLHSKAKLSLYRSFKLSLSSSYQLGHSATVTVWLHGPPCSLFAFRYTLTVSIMIWGNMWPQSLKHRRSVTVLDEYKYTATSLISGLASLPSQLLCLICAFLSFCAFAPP